MRGSSPRRRPAARAVARQTTIAVPRSGSTTISRQASADDEQVRAPASRISRDHLRPRGEQVGAVEDQRQLGELRRLDLEAARRRSSGWRRSPTMPMPGTSTASRQDERDGRAAAASAAAAAAAPRTRQQAHHQQADGAEQQRPLQVVGAVAALRRAARWSSWR